MIILNYSQIPNPLLTINFKPIINNAYGKCLYNSFDNLNFYLEEIRISIISENYQLFIFFDYQNQQITGVPIKINQEYIYLDNNFLVKIKEIKKIRKSLR